MATPVRADGSKTPLRQPEERKRERSVSLSRASEYSYAEEEEEEEEHKARAEALTKPNMSTQEVQEALQKERHHNKRNFEMKSTMKTFQKQLQEATYDIETQTRISAHMLYKQLQTPGRCQTSITLFHSGGIP